MNSNSKSRWIIAALVLVITTVTVETVGVKPQAQNVTGSTTNASRVIGEVVTIDAAAKRISIKTDDGQIVAIQVDEKTAYLRIPAGDKTMERAVKISLSDIAVGDRVYARGSAAEGKAAIDARQLIAMTKADIQQKHERDRNEWQQRGLAGLITAINPQTQEITLKVQDGQTTSSLIVAPTQQARYRRYAPDSIKFKDARPGSFTDLQVGDQVRALGNKSADGSRFIPEEIVSGAFSTVAGTVNAVSSETNEIKITLIGGQQPITILLQKDSALRRITPEMAPLFIRPGQGEQKGGSDSQTNGGNTTAQQSGSGQNLLEAVEALPPVQLSEIKQGDVVLVFSTRGADPSRLTAITLVAGMESVLSRLQAKRPETRGKATNPNTGLPAGVLEFAIGLP